MYSCDICKKTYSTNFNRLKHMRNVHNQNLYLKKSNINCSDCKKTFKHLKDLRHHLTRDHNTELTIETLTVQNFSQFKEWKRKKETEHCCWYVAKRGATRLAGGRMKKEFVCHRSGDEKISKGKLKRNLKGSYKLNTTCPASMETIINVDGTVDVTFYSSHIDHSCEAKYLSLSREERKSIAMKLAKGYTFDEVLKLVKDSKKSENLSQRYYTVNKKDLHNIKAYFNLNEDSETDETSGDIKTNVNNQRNIDDKFIERDIKKLHCKGLRIKPEDIRELKVDQRLLWQIKNYEVEFMQPIMCNCNIKCSECKICAHMFKCSCYDATANENTICSHIHAITKYATRNGGTLVGFYTANKWRSTEVDELIDWESINDAQMKIESTGQYSSSDETETSAGNFNHLDISEKDTDNVIVYSFESDAVLSDSDQHFSVFELNDNETETYTENFGTSGLKNDNENIIVYSVECGALLGTDQNLTVLDFNECDGSYFMLDDFNLVC